MSIVRPSIVALLAVLSWGDARAAVEFKGLSRSTEKVVRATLRLDDEACDAAESRIRRLYRRAEREIRTALEVYGYFEPRVSGALDFSASCWVARYEIVRGPRVALRRVDVRIEGQGEADEEFRRLLGRGALQPGAGLNQRRYEDLKLSLATLAEQRGYFDARFTTQRVDIYPSERAADVSLAYDTGQRYRFGPVDIEQRVVDSELAARYVDFRPGDPFDATRISDLYSALLLTGYFRDVEIRTTPRPAPDRDVAVAISMTGAKRRTWTTGIGFATDLGAKLRLDYLNRRLNDAGHQFEFAGNASQVLGDASLSYRLPLGDPRDEWLSFDAGYKYENPEDSRSEQVKFGVKQVRRRRGSWLESRFVDFTQERFRIGDERSRSTLVVPGISWSNQTRQMPVRPLRAHRFSASIAGTTEAIGSDTAFLQLGLDGRLIRPITDDVRVLLRGEFGTTVKDRFEDLPFSVRYFAGGDYSVRGYDYKSLGPTDTDGAVVGGSHKLVASAEADWRFLPNWSAAAFVDVGNAFDTFQGLTLKTGVGAGIRWYSPLGAVRLDIGVPLDRDAPDSFRVHITLGPDL